MFSVVILTLNEEQGLPVCLKTLDPTLDVVVLDSGSLDRTREIALEAGARVIEHPFVDFAAQRNFAHKAISWKFPWLFHLDADEQLTPELIAECAAITREDPRHLDGYLVAPRMLFHGVWIKRSTDFPAYQARFGHTQRFRFVQRGHGQREEPEMRMARLQQNYLHNLSAHSDAELVEKHERYALQEAAQFLRQSTSGQPFRLNQLASGDPLARRRALKHLSYRLPARGFLRFVYQYLLRGGMLEGAAGLRYCRILAGYEQATARAIRRLRTTVR